MIDSKQSLADFCLRQLGAPVLNIEVDEEQLTDAIELAVQYYQEYHFEGIQRDFVKVVVTSDDINNRYFSMPDPIYSVIKVLNPASILGGSDLLFNLQYQIMYNEMQNITSGGGVGYLYSTLNNLAHLDFVLRREKSYRFNRRMNRVYLDINWDEIKVNDNLVFEVYRAVDPETYTEVYDDLWLKKYATALVKKQWGTNLGMKYDGMVLPGGVTYNGKYILEQAMAEIEALEEEARENSAPLGIFIG